MSEKLLELKGISKAFPGVQALGGVDFTLNKGEVHCIVGGNGAGKSTLIKILSGVYTPDEGEIIFEDADYKKLTPHISRELGIQTIYQETLLASSLSVAENIFLGDSILHQGGIVKWNEIRAKAKEILDLLEVDIDVNEKVRDLGIAGKQAVQIAKALANEATVMIFDEPTASFGRKEVDNLFKIIATLKARGVGIIYISHRIEEVFEIADRISVFKDGKSVAHHESTQNLDFNTLINEMVGRTTKQFYDRERVPLGEVTLEVNHLCGDGVKDASFQLRRGEVLGIGGMVGSKRTELLRLIFGAGSLQSGTVTHNGSTFVPSSPAEMIKKGFCMVTEDRAITGLLLRRNLKENIMICKYSKFPQVFLNLKEEKQIAQEEIERLSIKAESSDQLLLNLSGGNQQKVILAKWLLTKGDIFIMDEPTRGIDIAAKEDLYRLIVEIARNGGSVLLVSSDMPELVSMSDRMIIMRDGNVAGELQLEDISEENILRVIVGG